MRTIAAVLAAVVALGAQDEQKTVRVDDFESELSGWTAIKIDDSTGFGVDEDSAVAVARDPAQVKSGKGALTYTYELSAATVRVLGVQRPLDLTGMKSVRFWVRCSHATAVLFGINERGGANYQTSFYCPAGSWQEFAVNLDELALDDPAKDANGKLDLEDVESLHVMDLGSFLVRLLPDLKGSRTLGLDDVEFSGKSLARTTGATKSARGDPVHLVDSFESAVIRWAPVGIEIGEGPKIRVFEAPLATDADARTGRQSLKMTYTRQAMKVQGLMRSLEKLDLAKASRLELGLKTSRDGMFIVSIEEKDGSRYQKVVELKAADGWKGLSFPLAEFTKADDSQDENDALDAGQIKEMSIADFTTLAGAGTGAENVLRVDEVFFALSP
jgi:hypothetical protein